MPLQVLWSLTSVALLVTVVASGCQPKSDVPPQKIVENDWLVDVTEESGVDFSHTTGGTGDLYLPEIMGGGVAVFDANGDDLLDLYFTNQNGLLPGFESSPTDINRFYQQTSEGRFEDKTTIAGLGDGRYGMGVAVGDVDNDGDLDVYVTNYGPDRLYLNNGLGVFEDATDRAGIQVDGLSASAAFLDFDSDGDLDLYVTQYVYWDESIRCTTSSGHNSYCGPTAYPPASDRLLRNEGQGRFSDVSDEAGIGHVFAASLGVVVEDFNRDGWPDIYVANDAYANNLWLNRGDGTFVDEALMLGAAINELGQPEAGMGVLAEDLSGDGLVDLFVTHLDRETNTLYRGLADRSGFSDSTAAAGFGQASWHLTGFGVTAFDIELDGDLDLATANGRVTLATAPAPGSLLPEPWNRLAQPNHFYLNAGNATFAISGPKTQSFEKPIEISRGIVAADLDGDGGRDLVVANIQGSPRIFRNEAPRAGSWLRVQTIDPRLRRDALGAHVGVGVGDRVVWRTVRQASSYLSSSPALAHFTLPRENYFDNLYVQWPDGLDEVFAGGPGNRQITVRRGEGRARE